MGTTRWDATIGTLRAVQALVHDGDRTLETGCGASTVIFVARGANHTTISPEAEEHKLVRDYLKQIDVDDSRLECIVGESDSVLPAFRSERMLDIAFVDGGHAFPYPVIDWHYMSRLLKVGGSLVIDEFRFLPSHAPFGLCRPIPAGGLTVSWTNGPRFFTLIDEPSYGDYNLQAFNRRFDYGFAPLPSRARLILSSRATRMLRQIGLRYPALRQVWKRYSHAASD